MFFVLKEAEKSRAVLSHLAPDFIGEIDMLEHDFRHRESSRKIGHFFDRVTFSGDIFSRVAERDYWRGSTTIYRSTSYGVVLSPSTEHALPNQGNCPRHTYVVAFARSQKYFEKQCATCGESRGVVSIFRSQNENTPILYWYGGGLDGSGPLVRKGAGARSAAPASAGGPSAFWHLLRPATGGRADAVSVRPVLWRVAGLRDEWGLPD